MANGEKLPEEAVPGNDPTLISRRSLMMRIGLAGGVVLTPPGLLLLRDLIRNGRTSGGYQQFDQPEALEPKNINEVVSDGITSSWRKATVWPGLAILTPLVDLHSNPQLSDGSQIQWPSGEQQNHLIVQRPFMIGYSLINNGWNNPPVGPEVMGFYLPGSDQLAYFDQQANNDEVVLPTNSSAPIYDSNYNIVGEEVYLRPARQENSLNWRYLVNNNGGLYFSGVAKVVGRSAWASLDETASAYNAFETRSSDDLIQLPGGP